MASRSAGGNRTTTTVLHEPNRRTGVLRQSGAGDQVDTRQTYSGHVALLKQLAKTRLGTMAQRKGSAATARTPAPSTAGALTPIPRAAIQRESMPRKPSPPPPPSIYETDTATIFGEALDKSLNYLVSRFTMGLSPVALTE